MNWTFFVAGVQFHQLKTIKNDVKAGDELAMIPEPTNKFDPNAVKLCVEHDTEGEVQVGYVPKKISAEVGAFLITADNPVCKILDHNMAAKPWESLEVSISERESDE